MPTPPQPTEAASLMTAALPIVAVLAAVSLVAASAAGRLVRRLFAVSDGDARFQHMARATRRIVSFGVFVVTAALLMPPALEFIGIRTDVGLHDEEIVRWVSETGVRVAVLLLISFAAHRLAGAMITQAETNVVAAEAANGERRKRATTLASSARGAAGALIWTTGALMVLRELDVDITPILTGAGILGLAIGFGAQTLVRDIISGIFLITENQVRIGDLAFVNTVTGIVEEINLRTLVLRDLDGTVHVIPNGEIRMMANRSKDYAWAVLDLALSLDADTDAAVEAVRATVTDLHADPAFAPSLFGVLEVLGVDSMTETAVTVRFRLKTQPLKQWEIVREWRRRVKKSLEARGIRLAHPRLELTIRNADGTDADEVVVPPHAR
jgi:moderate conductance mechanosensitive channel